MTKAAEKFREYLRGIYSPLDTRNVVEWAETEINITRVTPMPGQFSTYSTPYMREPLECFADGQVKDLVLVFGTQLGKTTIIQIGTAWRICNKPQDIVWVMPGEGLCKSFSETRWMHFVNDSPLMAKQKSINPRKFKILEQEFSRCNLSFVGSNSPANLASRPAGLLLMDEVDKFREETDKETSALNLAENRTKAYDGSLRVKTSTPTTPQGAIWIEYLKGTQEKYMIPCGHCGEFIELLWAQVKWDKEAKIDEQWDLGRVAESAHYKCQCCNGVITNGMKGDMVRLGKWVATNKFSERGFRSFHMNSLYGPWKSCSFGELAVKFLRNCETLTGLQDFRNSTLAMPWEVVETSIGDTKITGLAGEYELGKCPLEDPVHVVLCADVGQLMQHWVVTAFASDGTSYVIDYGECLAPEDLLQLIGKEYPTPSGAMVKAECGLIDSGWGTNRVYQTCMDSRNFFHASRGSKATFGSKITNTVLREFPGVILYTYIDHAIKTELFIDRIKDGRPAIKIPKKVSVDFAKGLKGQKLVAKKTPSGRVLVWKEVRDDHYMDAIKLCHIAWHLLKND